MKLDDALAPQWGRRTFAVLIPIHTARRRQHEWLREKRDRVQRLAVAETCKAMLERPALPCSIRLTRCAPRTLDSDNLQAALKATRDSVAEWLGIDDADPRVRWLYEQEKTKTYGVRLEVLREL